MAVALLCKVRTRLKLLAFPNSPFLQVGQFPKMPYHALQSPYSLFGLGRTNNYIENLFVGSTMHLDEHYINIEDVIPNSKVDILPVQDRVTWKRQLFLRPGKWLPWVRGDELERRRVSHHINFDTL
ncbi:hypothetical protein ARMGADRAFT_51120 [Armillaria gallica]|uniref:T-cell immunomodulatory protein TIP C2 domain-containing protein n=1 Tax=Armillaria gallica TaxID=47427 RepID=A0A2H3EVK9_ARMGA|nr:hypothetical protein ARMGADRAFT_51120 [Armillaria gallica]